MADWDYTETSFFDRSVGRAGFRWVKLFIAATVLQNIEGLPYTCFRCYFPALLTSVNIEQGSYLLGETVDCFERKSL